MIGIIRHVNKDRRLGESRAFLEVEKVIFEQAGPIHAIATHKAFFDNVNFNLHFCWWIWTEMYRLYVLAVNLLCECHYKARIAQWYSPSTPITTTPSHN